jgi:CRISPR-associated protein Csm2
MNLDNQTQQRQNNQSRTNEVSFSIAGWDTDPVKKGEDLIDFIRQGRNSPITTGQVRKTLAAINIIRNEIIQNNSNSLELTESQTLRVKYLEARLAYQAGRLDWQHKFLRDKFFKPLITIVKQIGSDRQKFERFAMMMESIVAYHKFYGGRND